MSHPLLTVLVRHPELALNHLTAYGQLLHEEATSAAHTWVRQTAAWAALGLSLLAFVLLSGFALMLGYLFDQFHWSLVAVPAAAASGAVVAWLFTRQSSSGPAFAEFKAQMAADAQALQAMGETP